MKLITKRKVRHPKKKREYLPLAYSIRKSKAVNLFTIMAAMKSVSSAIQVASINSQFSPKEQRDFDICTAIINGAQSIAKESHKLKKFY